MEKEFLNNNQPVEKINSENWEEIKKKDPILDIQKLLSFNKLGCLLLSADRYEHALKLFLNGIGLFEKLNENESFDLMFFNNIYCNTGKTFSCLKQYDMAQYYYKHCISNHPLYKLIIKEEIFFKKVFNFEVKNIYADNKFNNNAENSESLNSDILNKHQLIRKYFEDRCKKLFLLYLLHLLFFFRINK